MGDGLEARLLKAEVADLEARARLASARAELLSREAAESALRCREIEVRIKREEAETGEVAFACFRDQVLLIVFLLTLIFIFALALFDLPLLKELGASGDLAFILGLTGSRIGRRS